VQDKISFLYLDHDGIGMQITSYRDSQKYGNSFMSLQFCRCTIPHIALI